MFLYFGFVFLACLIGQSSCGDDEEKEKPKSDYLVDIKDLILAEDATKYFNCDKKTGMKLTKVNKTHIKISGECDLLEDFPLDAFMQILGYERDKNNPNAYLEEPTFNITRPVCDFISSDRYIYPKLLDCSDFPNKCPVTKNHYKVDNYYVDMSDFPPNPPSDFWKIRLLMHEWGNCEAPVVSSADLYVELKRNKKKKEKKEKKEKKNKKGR